MLFRSVPVSSSWPFTPVPPPGLARHTWGARKECGPHPWIRRRSPVAAANQESRQHTPPPALPRSELPSGLYVGAPRCRGSEREAASANALLSGLRRHRVRPVLGAALNRRGVRLPAPSSGQEPSYVKTHGAARRGRGTGRGATARWAPGPEMFHVGAASRGQRRRAWRAGPTPRGEIGRAHV